MRFVGIDLAWSPRNPSGAAVLSADGQLLDVSPSLAGDDEIVAYIQSALPADAPGIVAVDAPLAVPNETGSRPCDRQVASIFGRFEAAPYPANRHNLSRYGGLRAEAIRQRLEAQGFDPSPNIESQTPTRRIIETFPHPATVSLFNLQRTLKYKARSQRGYPTRWRELERLRDYLATLAASSPPLHLPPAIAGAPITGLRGRALKGMEDQLDAIVCAYSASYAWHHGPRGYAFYGDSGTGHILVPMTPVMWGRIKSSPPRLLLLDRDGTLNRSVDERPPNHPDEVELLPGVAKKLHRLAADGWRLVIITNQGGVAYGYHTEPKALAILQAVLKALPVPVDASYLCPHHPRGTIPEFAVDCPNRKPAPGAIRDALDRFQARAEDCLFVGDRRSDLQAASAAGVPFQWATVFFEH
jgi:histidinol-phosphate phosphatase family protein